MGEFIKLNIKLAGKLIVQKIACSAQRSRFIYSLTPERDVAVPKRR